MTNKTRPINQHTDLWSTKQTHRFVGNWKPKTETLKLETRNRIPYTGGID
ncbi:hypothetical protein KKF81_07185 [Candidatus Micrarchaeota archaeon]|nr:hypothetical protein [Candidatus Micrarchaeota archaeon]MBU1166714.1 hypothetical protein [Candidatus Micrarchaeota archaeon]MBU1886647.1 hypothetical protein [Candidatus Micrarchaeota archaeon]